MSQFDLAIGMDAAALSRGAAQLYANPQARARLFKGEQAGEQGGLAYTANWQIQAEPYFELAPPPLDLWQEAVDATGQAPTGEPPAGSSFQLWLPQFQASYSLAGSEPVSGAGEVAVFARVAIADRSLTITPDAIWVDQSQVTLWDQLFLNIILQQVLAQAGTMLAGLRLPPLSFDEGGVRLSLLPPLVRIEAGRLIIASGLQGKGSVEIGQSAWPDQSIFLLLSKDLIEHVARDAAQARLAGKEFSGSGSYPSEGEFSGALTYEWSARVDSVGTIRADPADMTQIKVPAGLSFEATIKPLNVGGPCAVTAATGSL